MSWQRWWRGRNLDENRFCWFTGILLNYEGNETFVEEIPRKLLEAELSHFHKRVKRREMRMWQELITGETLGRDRKKNGSIQ